MALTLDVREEVVQACRVLAAAGLDDMIWGHAARRDDAGRGLWIKRYGRAMAEVDVADVHLLDWNGQVIEGGGRPHLEWPIHAAILEARPDVGGIVHTHGVSAIAMCATGAELLPISHEGTMFVPPGVPVFRETGCLIDSLAIGRRVAASLSDATAILLGRHGSVTVGGDLALAAVNAIVLDRACAVQLAAMSSASGPLDYSGAEEAATKQAVCWAPSQRYAAWDYLVRSLPGAAL